MVLSYSRMIFAKFFFDQTIDSFLCGHVDGFTYFGGVPRTLRYDNLKAAVAARYGQTIRYNTQLLEAAAHFGFKPSACNPYSGHEKEDIAYYTSFKL
jgi:transposase